jgi:hypothetical protein
LHTSKRRRRKHSSPGLGARSSGETSDDESDDGLDGGAADLVALLVADLDELVTVPLFDEQLPVEVASRILTFLDYKTLVRARSIAGHFRRTFSVAAVEA